MCQVQEDHRLHPHSLGHLTNQQEVYYFSNVTDIVAMHQCNADWEEKIMTGLHYWVHTEGVRGAAIVH